jgi:hypothetical protein
VKRLHLLLVAAAAVVAGVAGVAGARADSAGKIQLCHGTASATNPFVLIDVSLNAVPAQMTDTGQREQTFQYDPTYPTCLEQFLANQTL